MKKKTFIEFLKEQDSTEMMYIGMKQGTNFIYIETAAEVIKNINKLENYLKNNAKRTLSESRAKIAKLPYDIVNLRTKISEETDKKERNRLEACLEEKNRQFASAYNQRNKYEKLLNEWITLPNRVVVETYEHEDNIPGTTVLLQGIEAGTLWFYGESKVI